MSLTTGTMNTGITAATMTAIGYTIPMGITVYIMYGGIRGGGIIIGGDAIGVTTLPGISTMPGSM